MSRMSRNTIENAPLEGQEVETVENPKTPKAFRVSSEIEKEVIKDALTKYKESGVMADQNLPHVFKRLLESTLNDLIVKVSDCI